MLTRSHRQHLKHANAAVDRQVYAETVAKIIIVVEPSTMDPIIRRIKLDCGAELSWWERFMPLCR